MRLNCKITERLKEEFSTLWQCEQRGKTLEISTPYRMPDSTLFTLFLTERGDRYVACDGGRIWKIVRELCEIPEEEALIQLRAMASENEIKEDNSQGFPMFYKDCREETLIGSISFDVANFATMAASVLMAIDLGPRSPKQ